jgi:O-antigen ligase
VLAATNGPTGLAVASDGTIYFADYANHRVKAVDPSGVLVASDIARFNAWRASIEIWADNPLVGIGFGRYGSVADAYGDADLNSPHNEWLRLFAEGGIVVGLVGAAWIAATVVTLARVPGWVGAGALATALGWGVASTFNNPLLFIQVSTVAFTIMGTGLARARGWPITRGSSPVAVDAATAEAAVAQAEVAPAPADSAGVSAEAARGDATDATPDGAPDDTTPEPSDPSGRSATAPPPTGT